LTCRDLQICSESAADSPIGSNIRPTPPRLTSDFERRLKAIEIADRERDDPRGSAGGFGKN
jgi:hypothetical protein